MSSFPSSRLQYGDTLPAESEIARYCKPSDFDSRTDEPRVSAFQTRPRERDLSVNYLDYYSRDSREDNVLAIRLEVGANLQLRRNGRFLVLEVGRAISAAKSVGQNIDVAFTPKPKQPSHSSIQGLPSTENRGERTATATALKRLIGKDDIYPAT